MIFLHPKGIMMNRFQKLVLTFTLTLGCIVAPSIGHASLIDLGNGAIYDTTRNVTWTQNLRYDEIDLYPTSRLTGLWGLSVTNVGSTTHTVTEVDIYQINSAPFLVGGTWWGATAYATTLSFAGASNWRLPTQAELIGVIGDSQFSSGIFARTGDARGQYLMWTSTETGEMTAVIVDLLSPRDYYGSSVPKATPSSGSIFVAWAAHDGNINAVPEVNSGALLLLGLFLLSAFTARSNIKPRCPAESGVA